MGRICGFLLANHAGGGVVTSDLENPDESLGTVRLAADLPTQRPLAGLLQLVAPWRVRRSGHDYGRKRCTMSRAFGLKSASACTLSQVF